MVLVDRALAALGSLSWVWGLPVSPKSSTNRRREGGRATQRTIDPSLMFRQHAYCEGPISSFQPVTKKPCLENIRK